MNKNTVRWLAGLTALLAMGALAGAAEAVPQEDEQCLAQCDADSDRCMSDAAGDDNKEKACDDKYTDCLKQCR